MSKPDAAVEEPLVARVVHRSLVVDQPGLRPVVKLMLNLAPGERRFAPGTDIAFLAPGHATDAPRGGLRRYTVDSVGAVPFEDSIDITIHVRDHGGAAGAGMAHQLSGLKSGAYRIWCPTPDRAMELPPVDVKVSSDVSGVTITLPPPPGEEPVPGEEAPPEGIEELPEAMRERIRPPR